MPKRDYIAEIIEIKSRRLKKGTRFEQLSRRYYSILDTLLFTLENEDLDKNVEREILRYIPIGLVACVQGFFKLVISDLIDKVPECRENVRNFKDLKLDIDVVLAIHKKDVSLGDFVSHLVPLSNFDALNSAMSILLGEKFMRLVETVEWENSAGNTVKYDPFITQHLIELFDIRNNYCHEIVPKKESVVELSKRAAFITVTIISFFYATERLVEDKINSAA